MKGVLPILMLLYSSILSFAQIGDSLQISFMPMLNGEIVQASDDQLESQPIDSLSIESFKCYISKIELSNKDSLVFEETDSYHLIDIENPESLSHQLVIPEDISYDAISFNIGIDSLTNMDGAQGGDLDPIHGMYWSWQSGYINYKIEGTAKNCPSRKNRFQFHIGGYQAPFNSCQSVELDVFNKDEIKIEISMDQLFDQIKLEHLYNIMSPGEAGIHFNKVFGKVFSIQE